MKKPFLYYSYLFEKKYDSKSFKIVETKKSMLLFIFIKKSNLKPTANIL